MKIRKGDTVQIIAGKDKGKTGTILTALPRTEQVIIEGMNVVKKHQKNRRVRSQGQIIDKSLPIHVSNVALLDGNKPVRVGYNIEGEGEKRKKVRVARPSGKKL
ncbi:MAG: 50S ribosomal protein L24 [Parcubacteria bacterium OLB19]|nr:MAG: 50S ribosomal protein L24 [Parcubacteria bacterium OLB19]